MENINIKTWDSMYAEGRSLLIWPNEAIIGFLNRNRGKFKKAIDIGCGAGRHALFLAQSGIESIGIDSSPAGIEFAKKRAKEMGIKNASFKCTRAQDADLENESFDLVVMWGLVHYMEEPDRKEIINTVLRILKKGGHMLATMRSTDDTRSQAGKPAGKNQLLVDYFDEKTGTPKQTLMFFWDEAGVREELAGFSEVNLGHRSLEPIGKLGNKSSHWYIDAVK